MRIATGMHEPIRKRPYCAPLKERKMVDSAVDEMMQTGVIERSNSPCGFPIVLVEKKDDSKRFWVDFRALNKITKNMLNFFQLLIIYWHHLGRQGTFRSLV